MQDKVVFSTTEPPPPSEVSELQVPILVDPAVIRNKVIDLLQREAATCSRNGAKRNANIIRNLIVLVRGEIG